MMPGLMDPAFFVWERCSRGSEAPRSKTLPNHNEKGVLSHTFHNTSLKSAYGAAIKSKEARSSERKSTRVGSVNV